MALQPIGDRIIVKREESEAKTKGGIILPDAAQKKPQTGTVVAVGPGKINKDGTRTALQLKAGDKASSPPGPATSSRTRRIRMKCW